MQYNYNNLLFTFNKNEEDGAGILRMDLTFDKKVEVENALDLIISEMYLLVGGNIGNVYPKTNNYVYATDINLTFKYKDGSEANKTAQIPWNWSAGTNLKGAGSDRIYIGQNPCDKRSALYHLGCRTITL